MFFIHGLEHVHVLLRRHRTKIFRHNMGRVYPSDNVPTVIIIANCFLKSTLDNVVLS